MSAPILAVAVAVIGIVLSALWFGVSRRRKAETEVGIQTLANLKWRDCIAVVLEALHREGYERGADGEPSGGGATEFLLRRDGEDVLLGYKHGTAYHLTDINVREFVNATSLHGARSGILLTLGSTTPAARRVAAGHNVQLLDGAALWPKVRQYVPPNLLEEVRRQASARTAKGLWTGVGASVAAGVLIFFLNQPKGQPKGPEPVAAADVQAARAAPDAPRSDAAMLKQINATAKAMAEVAKLSTEQLAKRRVDAAQQVSLLPQVDRAAWAAQRTLLVTLHGSDGKDKNLLDEICRILTQNEEMRFTRVQLESPESTRQAVRWRLCD